ncbi:MAG: protein phosphatase 2C domain-containing protein, partial [Kordiimonadaceae bacterium]|nr:protein phosphatase 2C domain-containing protein [Kordiimonadaceae bacterium]
MAENQLTVQVGQYSRKGAHDTNADSYGVMCPSGRTLELKGIAAAIADGMSTSTAAKEASETSVKSFLCDYLDAPESWAIKTAASRILSATNRWLHGQSHSRFENGMDMVTTFSGLILQGGEASIFHIGDSRIYRLRQGELKQLTRDHTLRSAGGHEHLAKALGADVHIAVDHRSEVLKSGDVFLFTTDGVHSVLSNQQLQETLATHCTDPDTCAKTIVEKADMAGSADDMSCQIIVVEEVGQAKEDTHLKALAELPFPPPLKAGMTLDGYRIIRELYASPRSQVYLVADEETGGKFVLKTPSDNFEDDAIYLELFSREEWIAQTAASPNIVTAPTNNRPRNFLYTVFEYIDGQTLRQWLNDRQEPSLPDTRDIIAQIISGVRVLHRKEIIHQDLKPENILIDQEG